MECGVGSGEGSGEGRGGCCGGYLNPAKRYQQLCCRGGVRHRRWPSARHAHTGTSYGAGSVRGVSDLGSGCRVIPMARNLLCLLEAGVVREGALAGGGGGGGGEADRGDREAEHAERHHHGK